MLRVGHKPPLGSDPRANLAAQLCVWLGSKAPSSIGDLCPFPVRGLDHHLGPLEPETELCDEAGAQIAEGASVSRDTVLQECLAIVEADARDLVGYLLTATRMISGLVRKDPKELGLLMPSRVAGPLPCSCRIALTAPLWVDTAPRQGCQGSPLGTSGRNVPPQASRA